MDKEDFFRVEYNKSEEGVIPTVWMGVQGFDLRTQIADGDWSAQKKAEWFSSMFKKAIDNYANEKYKETINSITDKNIESRFPVHTKNGRIESNRNRRSGAKWLKRVLLSIKINNKNGSN